MNPDITVDYPTLKAAVRAGLSNEGRKFWYPLLANIKDQKFNMKEYPDVSGSAERLLKMSCPHSLIAEVEEDINLKYDMLTFSLKDADSMGECPILLDGFLQIISEIIPRFDICYLIARDILECNERPFCTTKREYKSKLYAFRELLRNYMPKTYTALNNLSGLDDKYLNLIFMDFFKTLLPMEDVLRIMDAYLLEGDKVLMRYGLSLIKLYKASLKSGVYKSSDSFWQSVQSDAATKTVFPIKARNRHHYKSGSARKSDNCRSYTDSISSSDSLHGYAFEVDRGTVSKIFRPMNVSRNKLSQLTREGAGAFRERDDSFEPPFYPTYKIDSSDDSSTEFIAVPDPPNRKAKKQAPSTLNIAESVASYSTILSNRTSAQLLALCCPEIDHKEQLTSHTSSSSSSSMYDEGLYLVFSTAKDGFSLSSLYEHTKGMSPLVIVVRSVSPSSSDPMVVGAYFNEPMKANPSKKVRGNGENFLFTLSNKDLPKNTRSNSKHYKHTAKKYQWAMSNHEVPSHNGTYDDLYEVASKPVKDGAKKEGTLTQFSVFSPSFISFGGSEEYSTSALRLDEDLSICHCGPSDTYGNSDHSILEGTRREDKDEDVDISFKIDTVEVYSDKGSFERLGGHQSRSRDRACI